MQVGEGVAVPVPAPPEQPPPKLYGCKWQDCEKKHTEDIDPKYGSGSVAKGAATSGKGYEAEWVANKMEPWEMRGTGRNPNAKQPDFEAEIDATKGKNAAMIAKAVATPHPEYTTQKHHIISVHLFDSFTKLGHDAALVDYNVNDKENGICLPYFELDIVQHDLQCHRGPHPPMYDERVSDLLRDEEKECVKYCTQDLQKSLKPNLERIADRVETHIEKWTAGWYLRSTAVTDRANAYKRINVPVPP